MEINCENCGNLFFITKEQEVSVREAVEKNNNFLVSRCPICHRNITLHPMTLLGISNDIEEIKDTRLFYCPTPQCIGFVEYDKTNNLYECLECGSSWKNQQELFNSISDVIKKYPHRKSVYMKTKNGWKSMPIGTSPKNYGSMVQNEEKDD